MQGEDYGFVVLSKGSVSRRVPYFFLVDKPALANATVLPLKRTQSGDTPGRVGTNVVEAYRYPVAPFGNAPDTPPMVEDGNEKVYVTSVNEPAANAGVSVMPSTPGAQIDRSPSDSTRTRCRVSPVRPSTSTRSRTTI